MFWAVSVSIHPRPGNEQRRGELIIRPSHTTLNAPSETQHRLAPLGLGQWMRVPSELNSLTDDHGEFVRNPLPNSLRSN